MKIENDPDCSGSIPNGGVCVTVPSYSCGYFTVQMDPYVQRLGENTNVFSIYPNPAYSQFTLKNNEGVEYNDKIIIEIFNITGKLMLVIEYENEQSINISNLPSGIYMVSITNLNNETEIKKLIKMK